MKETQRIGDGLDKGEEGYMLPRGTVLDSSFGSLGRLEMVSKLEISIIFYSMILTSFCAVYCFVMLVGWFCHSGGCWS